MALLELINNTDQLSAFIYGFSLSSYFEPKPQFYENFCLWAQHADDGIVIADSQNKILFANPFVSKITHYSQRKLESLSLDQLFKISHKSLFKPKNEDNGKPTRFQSCQFKAQLIGNGEKLLAVDVTAAQTRWNRESARILIFRVVKQAGKKEKALKSGLKKMQNRMRKKGQKLAAFEGQLQQLQKALCGKQDEVNKLANELVETNYALSALAKHLDNEKTAYESGIARSVVTKILPIVKTLQQDKKLARYALELNLLESYIGSLAPDGLKNQRLFIQLTEAEGQIATLIRKGMTSRKIAVLLSISDETVRTHRKNIRKKLKIKNTDLNLRAYLNQNTTRRRERRT